MSDELIKQIESVLTEGKAGFAKGDKVLNTLTNSKYTVVAVGKDEDGDYIHVKDKKGETIVLGSDKFPNLKKFKESEECMIPKLY